MPTIAAHRLVLLASVIATTLVVGAGGAAAAKPKPPAQPDFGPNVVVFDPGMSTEPDSGNRRRDRRPAGAEPVRDAALRAPVRARHLRHGFRSAELPGRLLHERRWARPVAERRRRQRLDLRAQPVRERQLHRAEQLLALAVEPDHQCDEPELRLLHRRVLGSLAGGADAPGARERAHHADGLLHRPVVRERRVHRRLEVRRRHSDQRLPAAVAGPEQLARRLDQRRLEPGVLGRRQRARPVLPGGRLVRRPVHDASHEPGHSGRAVPVRGLEWELQGLRAVRAARLGRGLVGRRDDGRLVDLDRRLLHRQADGRRAGDQQRALPRPEPDLHARRLPPGQDDQGEARRHRRARARLPDARAHERLGDDDRRRRPRREARRVDVRRRSRELAGAAASGDAARAQERPGRSDLAAGRVLPHRRGDAGQGCRPAWS